VPEQFFEGTTQAGRELRLYYEHTAYDTFTDETGEVVHNRAETKITATLDGAPIEVDGVNWTGHGATIRSLDHGTFTATDTDYADDHREALRRYLEHRPSGGWEVTIVDKARQSDEWRYTVTITNGRLTERASFHLSSQVVRTLARDGTVPPADEAVARQLAQTLRSDTWADIQRRAAEPTTLMWLANPS
jgi:hypothetical protein